jgi:outer membrane immunogenic protein
MELIMSQIIVTGRLTAPLLWPRSRLISLSTVLGAALSVVQPLTATRAADLPTKAPATPSVYTWGGCYVGVNIGGGGAGSDFNSAVGNGTHLQPADAALVSSSGTGSANDTGFLGGGQTGCNWQSGSLVYGIEGDLDYFHSQPSFSNNTNTLSDGVTPFTATQTLTTDFLATIRPRIGIAADRNLAYLTGGVAFTRVSYAQSYADGVIPAGAGSATASKSLVGWTAGAGWEHAWTNNWTFKIEYLFASFPTTSAVGSITDGAGGSNPLHGSADLVIQTVRAGVNYKF